MDSYQEEQEKSSGSSLKWGILAGVLGLTLVVGAAVGIPSYAKYQNKQFCKSAVTEFNHAFIKTNISVDLIKNEADSSFMEDVYRYDFYSGPNKIFTLVQNNSYGLTSVDSVLSLDEKSVDISNTDLVNYLKTLKLESSYAFLGDSLETKFTVPAYSFKEGDISASWSDGIFESSLSNVSSGFSGMIRRSVHSEIKSIKVDTPEVRFNMDNMVSTKTEGSIGEFAVYLIGDKEVVPEEQPAESAVQNDEQAAAEGQDDTVTASVKPEPVIEKGVVGSFVMKNFKATTDLPDVIYGDVAGGSLDMALESLVYDVDDVNLDFKNSNIKMSINNINAVALRDNCGTKSYHVCVQDKDPQSQMEIMSQILSGATFRMTINTVLNNGPIVFDTTMEYGRLSKNMSQMELVNNTKIDAHLEFNKALLANLADEYDSFVMIQDFIAKYDKNNHADKYVTNFMCTNGLMSCTLNGTPLGSLR